MNSPFLSSLCLIFLSFTLSACTKTIIHPPFITTTSNQVLSSSPISMPVPNPLDGNLILDSQVTQKLAHLNNEVTVKNLLYVTHQSTLIDHENYVLLNFHTTDHKVYRTRVIQDKLNPKTLQQLQQLKGATLIGVMPIHGYQEQYFFRNFKNLKFE